MIYYVIENLFHSNQGPMSQTIFRSQWKFGRNNLFLWQFFLNSNSSPLHHYKCIVYPKKYAHGFCCALLCCGYTLTDFPISIRLTSLALWQSNDCPSASKATLMNMDEYFMWIHHERLHNHNKAKHNKTVCIFLGIYCNIFPDSIMAVTHASPFDKAKLLFRPI